MNLKIEIGNWRFVWRVGWWWFERDWIGNFFMEENGLDEVDEEEIFEEIESFRDCEDDDYVLVLF